MAIIHVITSPRTIQPKQSITVTVPSYNGTINKIIVTASKPSSGEGWPGIGGGGGLPAPFKINCGETQLAHFKDATGTSQQQNISYNNSITSLSIHNIGSRFSTSSITIETLDLEYTEATSDPPKTIEIKTKVIPEGAGSATASPNRVTVSKGGAGTSNLSVTISNKIYAFKNWSSSNGSVKIKSPSSSTTALTCNYDSMPSAVTITANFYKPVKAGNVTIKLNPTSATTSGTSITKSYEIPENQDSTSISVTAPAAKKGYRFLKWINPSTGVTISSPSSEKTTLTINRNATNPSCEASYEKILKHIVIKKLLGTGIRSYDINATSGDVAIDRPVTFTISNIHYNDGYEFEKITVQPQAITVDNSKKTITVSYDDVSGGSEVEITVYARKSSVTSRSFTLEVRSATGGTSTPSAGKQTLTAKSNEQSISLQAKPNSGYKFESWTVGDQTFALNPYPYKYSLSNINKDGMTIIAIPKFKVIPKKTIKITMNGKITVKEVNETEQYYTFSAPASDGGKVFSKWIINGASYTDRDVKYSLANVNEVNAEAVYVTVDNAPVNILFKKGLSSKLSTQNHQDGTFYLTLDTHELWYDNKEDRFLVSGATPDPEGNNFLPLSGGTLTGKLKANGGISLNNKTPQETPSYILGIRSFDKGGDIVWQQATSVSVGSASKLATARTINGTSFNGTANITTTNWGTSRTITIGSKGKAVNGSGNVSWTLDEIGAAAKSHNHDDRYYTESEINTKLNNYPTKTGSGASGEWNITAAFLKAGNGTADAFRNIWFSDNNDPNHMVQNGAFQYNPSTNTLKVGRIQKAGQSVQWSKGRDGVLVKTTSVPGNSYCPVVSVKTKIGSWEIGAYDQSAYAEKLIFTYVKDSDYTGSSNVSKSYTINTDGVFSGSIDWGSVSGKPSKFPPESHGHSYCPYFYGGSNKPETYGYGFLTDPSTYNQSGKADNYGFFVSSSNNAYIGQEVNGAGAMTWSRVLRGRKAGYFGTALPSNSDGKDGDVFFKII